MRTQWAWVILVALGNASCSQSEPSIGIEKLEGVYRAASCPDIIIRGNRLITGSGETSYELIRLKRNDILETASTPRFDLSGPCTLVMAPEPSFIPIERSNGRIAFDIVSVDRTQSIRFVQAE